MHEFAVTRNMLDTVLYEAEAAGAVRVTGIYLAIGEISSIINDSVRFYFQLFSKGTIARDAEIFIKRIKPEFMCCDCGHIFIFDRISFDCPACGGTGKPTEKGHEFYIEKIEIE